MTCVNEVEIVGLIFDDSPAWDGGARSIISFDGDGWFGWEVAESVVGAVVGLNTNDANYHYSDIQHGFHFRRGDFRIIEDGVWKGSWIPFSTGDRFYVFRSGGDVLYIHCTETDGTFFTTDPRYPGLLLPDEILDVREDASFGTVFLDASLYKISDYIYNEDGGEVWLPDPTAGNNLPGNEAIFRGSLPFAGVAAGSDTGSGFNGAAYGELSFGLTASGSIPEGLFAGPGRTGGILPFVLRAGDTLRGWMRGELPFAGGLGNGSAGSDGLQDVANGGAMRGYFGFDLAAAGVPGFVKGLTNGQLPFIVDGFGQRGTPVDPDFSNVTLLLGFNGVDGTNTFTDSSSFSRTVTTNGNVEIDDAVTRPGFNEAGLFPGAAGDYLSVTNNAGLLDPSDDFTIELSVRVNTALPSASDQYVLISTRPTSTSSGFIFTLMDNGALRFYGYNTVGSYTGDTGSDGALPLVPDTWYSVALVHTAATSTVRIYVDGELHDEATYEGTLSLGDSVMQIGRQDNGGTDREFDGWFDELRITNGVARVPEPVAGDPDWLSVDVLITAEDPGLEYTNFAPGTPSTLTRIGTAAKTGVSPITGTQSYDSAPTDAIAIDALSDFGTSDFTIEMFVKFDAAAANSGFIFDSSASVLRISRNGSGNLVADLGAYNSAIAGPALANDTLYHIAVSRASGTSRMFVNGEQVGADYADSTNYQFGAGTQVLGSIFNASFGGVDGLMDGMRITNGVGRYTAPFIPPGSAPWTPAETTTKLWLDAADATTLTAPGGEVSQWTDKSGNSYVFDQGTPALRPDTGTSQNGLTTLNFEDDWLESTAAASEWAFLSNGNEFTAFVVAKHGNVAEPDDLAPFISTIGLSSAQTGYNLFADDRSAFTIDNRARSFAGRSAAPGVLDNSGEDGSFPGNEYAILSDTTDLNSGTPALRSTIRVNDGTGIANNALTGGPVATAPTTTLRLGNANGTTLTGQIGEVIIVEGTLSESDRQRFAGYLAHKWGLESELPPGHPYENAPPTTTGTIPEWPQSEDGDGSYEPPTEEFPETDTPGGAPDPQQGVMVGEFAFDFFGYSLMLTGNYFNILLPELGAEAGEPNVYEEELSDILRTITDVVTGNSFVESISETFVVTAAIEAFYAFHIKETITATLTLQQFTQQAVEILTSFSVTDRVRIALVLRIAEQIEANGTLTAVEAAQIVEQLLVSGLVQTQYQAIETLLSAVTFADLSIAAFSKTVTDAATFSDEAQIALAIRAMISEAMQIVDSTENQLYLMAIVEEQADISDDTQLTAQYFAELLDNGHFYALLKTPAELAQGWVMNTEGRMPVSEYDNYTFNSLAYAPHEMLGCTDEGVFTMSGDDDAGIPITAELTSLMLDFATSRQKRLSAAWIGYKADGELVLKIRAVDMDELVEYAFVGRNLLDAPAPQENRFKIGKGMRSRYWQFELVNVDGADFEIDQVELYPIRLDRRI
jgi:hypothetical protein